MIYGYIRVSTAEQNGESQKNQISRYATEKKLIIDEWIEVQISSRKSQLKRRIAELLDKVSSGDTIICSELSRLARSSVELYSLTNELIEKGCTVILIKQNLVLDKVSSDKMNTKVLLMAWSLAAELERDMVRERTNEGLKVAKIAGKKFGKPKGTIQKSMYDKDKDKIMEFYKLGVSLPKILTLLGYGNKNRLSLRNYIQKQIRT
jgi:DNA invertase Pin-like site-specific DNA recombinase